VTGVSIPETLLIFVGAPAAIYGVIALAVVGPGQMRAPARYRPGRPWPYEPAWFVPHPDNEAAPAGGHVAELTGAGAAELEAAAAHPAVAVGGASGEW
jgi:hypothetical protein